MARIRSTHPDQWTDDEFVACSPLARLLSLGIRNFADDNGIIPYTPTRWKRWVLPDDPCNPDELAAELVRTRQIVLFEARGQTYAAIRNFRRFQKPKSPTYTHPLPEWWGSDGEGLPNASPMPSPPLPTGEKGKGIGEDGNGGERSARAREDLPDDAEPLPSTGERFVSRFENGPDFDRFRLAYPDRGGSQPWKRAMDEATKRVNEGHDFEEMIAGAGRYLRFCEATKQVGTRFVMQAATFLGPEKHFLEPWDAPPPDPGRKTSGDRILDAIRRYDEIYGDDHDDRPNQAPLGEAP